MKSLLSVVGLKFNQVILCVQLSVNRQGLLADKKREGKYFGVFSCRNACTKRIYQRLDRNVADKTLFEYLYRVVVECFSP